MSRTSIRQTIMICLSIIYPIIKCPNKISHGKMLHINPLIIKKRDAARQHPFSKTQNKKAGLQGKSLFKKLLLRADLIFVAIDTKGTFIEDLLHKPAHTADILHGG